MNTRERGFIVTGGRERIDRIDWILTKFYKKYFTYSVGVLYPFWNSPPFILSDARWSLQIHPNGQENSFRSHVCLYLVKREDSQADIVKRFRFGLKGVNGEELHSIDCIFDAGDTSKGGMLMPRQTMEDMKVMLNSKPAAVTFFCRVLARHEETRSQDGSESSDDPGPRDDSGPSDNSGPSDDSGSGDDSEANEVADDLHKMSLQVRPRGNLSS